MLIESKPAPPVIVWPLASITVLESVSTVKVTSPPALAAVKPDAVEGIPAMTKSPAPATDMALMSFTDPLRSIWLSVP